MKKVSSKRKTVVEIGLPIWAEVRYFATLNRISNNAALETLLIEALKDHSVKDKAEMLAGENKFGNHSPAASHEVH